MTNGEQFIPAGQQRHATFMEVCKWVLAAWHRIKPAAIHNGFCKCEILPDVDSFSSESDYDNNSDSAPQTSTVTKACLALIMDLMDVFQDSDYDESFDDFENSDAEEDAADADCNNQNE